MLKGRKVMGLVVAAFCLLVGSGQCRGYVLCPEHILSLMLKKTRPPSGFVVNQNVFLDNVACDIADGHPRIEETLWYLPPGRFRSEISDREGRRVYVAAEGRAVTIAGGRIVATRENELMAYHLPLAFQAWPELAASLERAGVDMTVSSLGRYQEEVAFVIGARYPDGSLPQLWVGRESFLPLRFVVGDSAAGSSMLEVRYLDWQSRDGFWYPARIELYQGGLIQRLICVVSRKRTTSFARDFFDISALEAAYPAVDLEAPGEPEKTDPEDDVRKTIDDFRKLYQ